MEKKLTRRDFLRGSFLLGSAFLFQARPIRADYVNSKVYPGYANLETLGILKHRVEQAYTYFEACELCPRKCGANRIKGEQGFCRATAQLMVHASQPHFGEEISLVGKNGSGTIFFSNCNLRCVFCQNWPIAHDGLGQEFQDADLAGMMLHLQEIGCHNINLVTPTHVMPNILNAVRIAYKQGLRLPLVYNTSGYERITVLKLLDGIVDIYLPDMKYMDADHAAKYSGNAFDYPKVAMKALLEMHRQVGEHTTNDRGIAVRGLMIRHLVMPNRVAGTDKFVKWVAENLPKSTYVNIMAQYHVAYKAYEYPQIWRRINVQEYLEAMEWAQKAGLTHLDPISLKILKIYKKTQGSES
jgi:putative pyruvate formate lyase activating enzyme